MAAPPAPATPGPPVLTKEEVYHNTFRRLLEDITTTLRQDHGIDITESFAVMIVKIVSLNVENKFLIRQPIVRSEIERLKKIVIERVRGMAPIARNIIRMQLHYRANYFPRHVLIEAHRYEVEEEIRPLIHDLRSTIPKHLRHYELYYQKLIAATIARSGMGPTNEFPIIKQTEAALASVFPVDDINLLTTMTVKDRESELRHLMKMTTGIRLYNREVDPETGVGIPDLIGILPAKIEASSKQITELRTRNIKRLITYTTLTQPYFLGTYQASKLGRRCVSEQMILVRQGLVMVHQILIYLKDLTDEVGYEERRCEDLIARYKNCIQDLSGTVSNSESVPTFIVYPKFVDLANSWEKIQESLAYATTCADMVEALQRFTENDLKQLDPLVMAYLKKCRIKVPTEDRFFSFPELTLAEDQYALARRASFSFDMDPLDTQYSGFCVWALVNGLGLVVLSNPNIGVFHWHGMEFLVSSPEAGEEFRKDPETFVFKAVHIVQRWPELIFLLNMDKDVFSPDYVAEANRAKSAVHAHALITKEAQIQTDTHPLDTNIVPGYSWNEWDYRRRALILSKVHRCSTHSTQTHWQALKKSQQVQTYPLRNRITQTDSNVSSEAPRSQFWFYGLRGLHPHPPHIVELTRDDIFDQTILYPKATQGNVELPQSR